MRVFSGLWEITNCIVQGLSLGDTGEHGLDRVRVPLGPVIGPAVTSDLA